MAKTRNPNVGEVFSAKAGGATVKGKVKSFAGRYNTKRLGTTVVSTSATPQSAAIATATYQLSTAGYAEMTYAGETTPNNAAINMLGALGCSINYSKGKDYSLKSDTTDTEVISNPHISDVGNIDPKTQLQSAKGKFTNSNDAFYQLDGDIPQGESTANRERRGSTMTPDVISVTADVVSINMDNTNSSTLSEFIKR